MRRQIITLVVTLAILIAAFGVPVSAQEDVSLRLWMHQNQAFIDATQALADAYMAENPNVTIEIENFEYGLFLQTLQTSMPAGDEADIMQLFGSWVCSYADQLASMPEDMAAEIDETVIFPAQLGGYDCGGELYGIPQEYNIEYGAVLVNPRMYEAAGLEYPPQWETWDDLIVDAQALTQIGEDGQMTVAGYNFINYDALYFLFLSEILQRGGQYWNEDQTAMTLDTPEVTATLEHLLSMVEAGVIDPVLYNGDSNWVGESFFTDMVGIGFIGPWIVAGALNDYPDFGDFGYLPTPHINPETPYFAADAGWGLTVSPNSPNQEVAWDFIKFATTTPDLALGWNITSGTIPALRTLVEDEAYQAQLLEAFPWVAPNLPVLEYGSYVGPLPNRDLFVVEILYPNLLAMFQGELSVEEAQQYIVEDTMAMFE